MVQPINREFTLAAADQDWYANNATGATIVLDQNASPDSQAYKVAVLNNGGNNLSGINFTITGLDGDGKVQSEVLAGPTGSATVYSVYYYTRVNSVTLSATLGVNTVDIGTTTQFATPTIGTDFGSIGAALAVDYSGTMTYTVQATLDNIQEKTPPYYWQAIGPSMNGATTPQNATSPQMGTAIRVITASYSGTPTFQVSALQAPNFR